MATGRARASAPRPRRQDVSRRQSGQPLAARPVGHHHRLPVLALVVGAVVITDQPAIITGSWTSWLVG